MCGILGFNNKGKENSTCVIKNLSRLLYHRGPDAYGFKIIKSRFGNVALGQTRLSIVDVSSDANQPYSYKKLHIVFNGEVYNYLSLKKKLLKKGYKFNTKSDVEVILKYLHCFGIEAVRDFNGMFAIVVYNEDLELFHFFRDRLGVKPLYYCLGELGVSFASEIKALQKLKFQNQDLNEEALSYTIKFGYPQSDITIYPKVEKSPPGKIISVDANKGKVVDIISFFEIEFSKKAKKTMKTYEDYKCELKKSLEDAVLIRIPKEVPYGIFLSGGIDSSIITAILKNYTPNLKTFTVGFPGFHLDESLFARRVARFLKTKHTEFELTDEDVLSAFEKMPMVWDEPLCDPSCIPTYILCAKAREQIKVVFSADGGDELFGGYNRYDQTIKWEKKIQNNSKKFNLLSNILNVSPILNSSRKVSKLIEVSKCTNIVERMQSLSATFTNTQISQLLKQKKNFSHKSNIFSNEVSELSNLLYCDISNYLTENILLKIDRASMAVGLEAREPILDPRVLEISMKLPDNFKIKHDVRKVILRDILEDYLPKELFNRPKMGFSPPYIEWMKGILYNKVKYLTSENMINDTNIFRIKFVKKLYERHMAGDERSSQQLWSIVTTQNWASHWL